MSITPVVRSSTTSSERVDELGPLERPPGPEQRLGGAGRDRGDEVDLRQRLAPAASDGGATVPPMTQTSLAVAAVGTFGSSPGLSTRALAPCITSILRSEATSCSRTTTGR